MYRDDGLLALIRRLPCQVPGCGAPAPSEPMHGNLLAHGKGRGLKADDSNVAAGCKACHRAIDQGSVMSYDERNLLWHQAHSRTMSELIKRGWLQVNRNAD
jgi:hypothetical protein